MNVYPAIRGKMGTWDYFAVKMTMGAVAQDVKFAKDIWDDKTLDEAIQRVLMTSRVKTDIVTYLINQRDRFFSSLVVAALHGKPKWYPVTMEDDARFDLLRDNERLNNTFGVLTFDGTQNYYALDGQHRLAAIKDLVDPYSDVSSDAPKGFKNEEISVIIVVPLEAETKEEFRTRYRRLFGHLNRYAKPMDLVTTIIMDEDDAFAIVTRRLVTEHQFFRYTGRHEESPKVKTVKGKNLRGTDSYFTSLETLYQMNINLLQSSIRKNRGWNNEGQKDKDFRRFRPEDKHLEKLFDELAMYWDSLIDTLPVLNEEPVKMRNHSAPISEDDSMDNALFWPIGQVILSSLARELLDMQVDPTNPTPESTKKALKPLKDICWDFHEAPWINVLLIPVSKSNSTTSHWRIRNEDRKEAELIVKRILMWQLGIDELSNQEIEGLRGDWDPILLPALERAEKDKLWQRTANSISR